MSDAKLVEAWRVFDPEQGPRGRLEEAVVERWEARSRSLVTEWLDLLRARPVVNGAWVLAALLTVLVATPVGALAGLVPRAMAGQVTNRAASPGKVLAKALGAGRAGELRRSGQRSAPRRP